MSKTTFLKFVASITTSLSVLSGCTAQEATPRRDTSKLDLEELTVADYFPRDSGVELTERVWYVSAYKDMQERPIRELPKRGRAYRFIWLRSFHPPLTVTAYFPDSGLGDGYVVGKYMELEPRRNRSDPTRLSHLKTTHIELSSERTEELAKIIDQFGFFQLDPYDKFTRPPLYDFEFRGRRIRSETCDMEDGATWAIEGWEHGIYRVLQRQSPDEGEPVRRLATLLMTEAKVLPINRKEIY